MVLARSLPSDRKFEAFGHQIETGVGERNVFLENSKRVALQSLANEKVQVVGSRTSALHVGIGYAVAKGWAKYKGNGEFDITTEGLAALGQLEDTE